jgi:hypothetical protein
MAIAAASMPNAVCDLNAKSSPRSSTDIVTA